MSYEIDLLCLLIKFPTYLKRLEVKEEYFVEYKNKVILKEMIKCYKENGFLNPVTMVESNKNFDVVLYATIKESDPITKSNADMKFEYFQIEIIKKYKKIKIQELNIQLTNQKINYDEFIKEVEMLEKLNIKRKQKTILKINDIDFTKKENSTFIKSNFEKMDKKIKGFGLGELSVWSGSNASAKSTILNQIAIEGMYQGYNTIIYSGELTPVKLTRWLVNQICGKHNMKYDKKGDYYYVHPETRDYVLKWLNKRLFLYNNEASTKSRDIIESIKENIIKNDVKMIILDNLMSMTLQSDNKYDGQSEFVKELSAMAKEYNVHIHFVCHPRKVTSFLRKIDIAGSGDITNIADNVFITHRVNNDFKMKTKEMYGENNQFQNSDYTNVIEICKHRETGTEDVFVGLYFQKESKQLLNTKEEVKDYGLW